MSELQALLAERPRVLGLISSELAELKEKFATPRRTEIEEDEYAELDESDLTAREQVILIRSARGVLMHELPPIGADEDVAELLPVADFTDELYLVLLTRHGWIKRTALSAFSKITARGLLCASLAEGDRVVRAAICSASDSVTRPSNHAPRPHIPLASF